MNTHPTEPRPSILAIMLDFDGWAAARPWSYSASYALLDGFEACGCDTLVLPSLNTGTTSGGPRQSNPWVEARDRIVGNRKFDQAWVWITHSYYSDEFWSWLSSVAPVRVGVLMESLTYSAQEIAQQSPVLALRHQTVLKELRHVTHVLSPDECDVDDIAWRTGRPTRQLHAMLPPDLVLGDDAPGGDRPVFLGSLYPKRLEFLAANQFEPVLKILAPPEQGTTFPARFDSMHKAFRGELERTGGSPELANAFVARLRELRKEAVRLVYSAYRDGFASVNLPALFKGFTGRVIESMASATPLITPHLEGRPKTAAMFGEGHDLLYYDPHRPDDLSRQVRRLAGDTTFQNHLVKNARRALLERMSAKAQICDYLDWIVSTRPRVPEAMPFVPFAVIAEAAASLPVPETLRALFGREAFFGGQSHAFQGDIRRHVFLAGALDAAGTTDRPIRALEIGSWVGASTLSIAEAMARRSSYGGSILCVDTWAPYFTLNDLRKGDPYVAIQSLLAAKVVYPLFQQNIQSAPPSVQIDVQHRRSTEALPLLEPASFDFIHIDASTSFDDVRADLLNASRLLRNGGILCGSNLEEQVGDFDLDYAIAHRTMDTLADQSTGALFHPGVALAIYGFFERRLATEIGFWAVRKTGDRYVDVSLNGLRSFIPNHLPPALKLQCRQLLETSAP